MDANTLLEEFNHPSSNYSAQPPLSLFMKRGFIQKIDCDISVQEIYDNMDKISKNIISGLHRKVEFLSKLPTDRIEVTFNIAWVPRNIKMFNTLFKVTPIIPLPSRCFYCQRYGHTQDFCRNTHPNCEFCSLHHFSEQCPQLNGDVKCINCKGQHAASSRLCPRYIFEFEVSKIAYIMNLGRSGAKTYLNGRDIFPLRSPRSFVSGGTPLSLNEPLGGNHGSQPKPVGDPPPPTPSVSSRMETPRGASGGAESPLLEPRINSKIFSRSKDLGNLLNNLTSKLTNLEASFIDEDNASEGNLVNENT